MYGPLEAVKQFYSVVDGAQEYNFNAGLWSFPCNSTLTVGFTWGGNNWTIASDNFNLGPTESGSDQCMGALSSQDLGMGDNVWVLGDTFMMNVYTVFSIDNNAVGFASLS
ncbi:hypothetical protein AcW1_006440 [Taiwanofungus camphoratus]|nr:hypothetical protein AcV5_009024 [Antrodia cinnamomea]KAI0924274.1 hypothetical protein AcW2_005201 [Antrodia cinnamomea]KAI0940883.1 hypothetical protein AcV7_003137 [Antrodia cinnamomea]KAI0954597.1 hypothetical protein AcW1_006440 [Antrodia cinnamomea]